jgi:hypothetical protein
MHIKHHPEDLKLERRGGGTLVIPRNRKENNIKINLK